MTNCGYKRGVMVILQQLAKVASSSKKNNVGF